MTPSYAERARAVAAVATGLEVGVLSMTVPVAQHLVDVDGSLLLCAPRATGDRPASPLSSPLAVAGRLPGPVLVATLTDVSAVPQPDRVRGRLRLTGALGPVAEPLHRDVAGLLGAGPGRPVLRLRPHRVALDWRVGPDRTGWRQVDPGAYAGADLDPLAGWEGGWTAHLDRDHPGLAAALAHRLRPGLAPDAVVRPVLVDRGAITLRVHHADAPHEDLRLPLGREVGCGCEARLALAELVEQVLGGPEHARCEQVAPSPHDER